MLICGFSQNLIRMAKHLFFCFSFHSFFQNWLTLMSCCPTWTLPISRAIAMTTCSHSLKTTDSPETKKTCTHTRTGRAAWSPHTPNLGLMLILDKHKDALPFSSSSCTVFILKPNEQGFKTQTHGSVAYLLFAPWRLLWTVQLYSIVFVYHTLCAH